MIISKKQKGQTLLEVLTALGVAVVVIVALSILAVSALRNAQHAKAQAEATKFVNEAIEEVRAVRDQRGWSTFSSFSVTPPDNCYSVTSSTPLNLVSVSCGGSPIVGSTQFTREIKLDGKDVTGGPSEPGCPIGNTCPGRMITVSVFWTDAYGSNTSQATTILTEWK
jgi:type II secretory pathway pseudopilin PulG